jgi:alkanesulfonate monooxygenase
VRTFAISPRNHDPETAWRDIHTTVRLADRFGFTGILAHTGNDTMVDPWLVGQHALDVSPRLRPLVAVNPMYHHPFAVAQLAASLSYRYQRGVFLNLVAGTSTPDRLALGDQTEHDRRYHRLREFGQAVLGLLGTTAPLTVDGEFYQLRAARLRWPGPAEFKPIPFIAGESPMAQECARELGAVRITMFGAQTPKPSTGLGEYAGLLVRATDEEAWQAAQDRYPADPDLLAAGESALRYTDAVWRRQAFTDAARTDLDAPPWFWTEPMRSLRLDCPLLVGGVDTLAGVLAEHLGSGVEDFIFDLAAAEEDFSWASEALRRAREIAGLPQADDSPATHVEH